MEKNYQELENLVDLKISLDSKIILLWQRKGWGFYPSENSTSLKQTIEKGRAKSFLGRGKPYMILPLIKEDKNYDKVINAFDNMRDLPYYTEFYRENNSIYINNQRIYPLESISFNGDLFLFVDQKFYQSNSPKKIKPKFPPIQINFKFIPFVSTNCINKYQERNIMDPPVIWLNQ